MDCVRIVVDFVKRWKGYTSVVILVLALSSLRRFFCLDLGLCIIAVDCVKRWKKWGEAGGEGRVRGGLPLNCDQNTIMMESDVYDCNPSSFTILLCDCQGSACDWCDCEKIGGLQESWWISRANTFTGIGSKSQQFSSNFGVDHNFGAILNIGSGAWPSVGHRTKAGFHDCDAVVQSGPI